MGNVIIDALNKYLQEQSTKKASITPRYKKGDKVRVCKNLEWNVSGAYGFLGKYCEVIDVNINTCPVMPIYWLSLNGETDFFYESELDWRIKSQVHV